MRPFELRMMVNGEKTIINTQLHRTLLQVLREDLGLTGAKDGCSQGDCGACVVVMNRFAVNSCLILAPQAEGAEIMTVEGLTQNGELHPLQRAFAEKWGFQCGYCTPAMLMVSYALLLHNPDPSVEEIKEAISGNLCRCTGYHPIVNSVRHAAELMRGLADG